MGVKAVVKVQHPDDIKCEITITMSLWEWKNVKEELGSCGKAGVVDFYYAIRNLVNRVSKQLDFDTEKGEG